MAHDNRPDYTVYVSEKGADDKNFYTRIGSAWLVAKDGISIRLQALPVSGELILFPPKPED